MMISYYGARANLYHLWQQHANWKHAEFAAALGYSQQWVKKWLKRFREEVATGMSVEQVLQGHSRARKHPPMKTHPLVVEQVLAIRDQPPEGLRRVPGQEAIRYYLQRDPRCSSSSSPFPPVARFIASSKPISASPSVESRSISPWSGQRP